MEKIKVLLVDDHRIVRDGIKALLADAADISIIGEAADGVELFEKLPGMNPDIIILDISLPGPSGIEVARQLAIDYPYIHIMILSMFTNEDFIFNAIKAGVKAYLPKNTTKPELIEAISTVMAGGEYYSSSISGIIMQNYVARAKTGDMVNAKKEDSLTQREREVLKLFAEGSSNQEIADRLFISIRTVESHKNHIMQKLELKSTVDMIKFAVKNKIIEL